MTEADLKKLGFKRTNVSEEESGDKPYHYYTYDFFKPPYCGLSLISCSNDDAKGGKWYVEVFEESRIKFKDKMWLKTFIETVKANKTKTKRK